VSKSGMAKNVVRAEGGIVVNELVLGAWCG